MPASSSSPTALVDAATAAGVPARPLSALESISLLQTLAAVTQTTVAEGDEIAAFTAALATLPDLHDVVVTADALHC